MLKSKNAARLCALAAVMAAAVLPWTILSTSRAPAQATPAKPLLSPAVLPGKGLAEHDFFYAGESKDRKMFIVKGGKVVWSYDDPQGKGEISDAELLSNGNVVLAHQTAAKVINADKKVLWNYPAPANCEVHTIQAIGKEHVMFVQNGPKPILRVVNFVTGETKKEFAFPVKNPNSTHGQVRHARLTADGTVLIAQMDLGKLSEFDFDGKQLWTYDAPGIWGAEPLKNGNILITTNQGSREINKKGDILWSYNAKADLPDYKNLSLQLAWRMPNGNTIIGNWTSQWAADGGKVDLTNAPVQFLEMTPDKKVVWALREWDNPNLGPATTYQVIDPKVVPEDVHFGDIK